MPAANASTAGFAAAFADAEFSANGLWGQIDLELLVDVVVFAEFAAAMGTVVRQRGVEDFVDDLGRRRPMRVGPMLGPGFSAGLLGILARRPLGEGRGLPLAAARSFIEAFLEIGDPLLEFVDFAIASRASGAWRLVHAAKVGNRGLTSCAENYLAGR
jgi:hypothetical protein